jgi:hypothetical protein
MFVSERPGILPGLFIFEFPECEFLIALDIE